MTEKGKQIRRDILQASFEAGACHIGSALSCVEILETIFYDLGVKPEDFVFSKASGSAAYYAILADLGCFPKEKLAHYLKHFPEASTEVPGVTHSVGSVGHGFAVAAGMAYADRSRRVYCLLSDGELQEGVTYETALFVKQKMLSNLYVVVDDNGIQACDRTENVMGLETAFEFYQRTLPNFSRVHTVKGQGVDFMEGRVEWHYRNISRPLLDKALECLI